MVLVLRAPPIQLLRERLKAKQRTHEKAKRLKVVSRQILSPPQNWDLLLSEHLVPLHVVQLFTMYNCTSTQYYNTLTLS